MSPSLFGMRYLARGLRRGNALLAFVGAALVAVRVARWLDRGGGGRIYRRRLRPGESIEIGVTRPDR